MSKQRLVLNDIYCPEQQFNVSGKNTFTFEAELTEWSAVCIIDGVKGVLKFSVKKGFKTDGCSAPWPFNKKLKKWWGVGKKDAAAVGHDILYMFKGHVSGLPKSLGDEDCDDYLFGGWILAGVSQVWATLGDFFVNVAHNKCHWGADQYHVKDLASVTWTPIMPDDSYLESLKNG